MPEELRALAARGNWNAQVAVEEMDRGAGLRPSAFFARPSTFELPVVRSSSLWCWLADLIVPPDALRLVPACHYEGSGRLLRRLLDNGALT